MAATHPLFMMYGLFGLYSLGSFLMALRFEAMLHNDSSAAMINHLPPPPPPIHLRAVTATKIELPDVKGIHSSSKMEADDARSSSIHENVKAADERQEVEVNKVRRGQEVNKGKTKKMPNLQRRLRNNRVDNEKLKKRRELIIEYRKREQLIQEEKRYEMEANYTAAVQARASNTSCVCLDCDIDNLCGGLWRGSSYPGMPSEEATLETTIHVVISHCDKPLDWLEGYLQGFTNVVSVHVLSKCGYEVEGAPDNAVIQALPNVGRCDHAYAYYITSVLPALVASADDDNSVVVFLKDTFTSEIHQNFGKDRSIITDMHKLETSCFYRNDLKSLVRVASSSNGFSCGLSNAVVSTYHDLDTLLHFNLTHYEKGEDEYKTNRDGVTFLSEYKNLGEFYDAVNIKPSQDLIQVCYGGIFSASTKNILKQDMIVWKKLESLLTRGDNIQEGHYAERSWGLLLASPLEQFQNEAVRKHSNSISDQVEGIMGALTLFPEVRVLESSPDNEY